jgi:hypothetical protein
MDNILPEKARLLEKLKAGEFNVSDFIFVQVRDFEEENFEKLEAFLSNHHESYKVIAN